MKYFVVSLTLIASLFIFTQASYAWVCIAPEDGSGEKHKPITVQEFTEKSNIVFLGKALSKKDGATKYQVLKRYKGLWPWNFQVNVKLTGMVYGGGAGFDAPPKIGDTKLIGANFNKGNLELVRFGECRKWGFTENELEKFLHN